MLNLAQVQGLLPANFQHLAAYVIQIANLYVAADPSCQSSLEDMYTRDAAASAAAATHAGYRAAFIEVCEPWGLPGNVRPLILAVPIPAAAPIAPAPPFNYRQHHAVDIARLRQMRT